MARPRKNIAAMKEYKPPLSGRTDRSHILLDFNERTVQNKPVIKALRKFLRKNDVRSYPEYHDLNKKISFYAKTKPENVLATNGSSEAIDLIIRAFVEKKDEAVILEPSFAMFSQFLQAQGAKIRKISYNEDMTFPFQKLAESINSKTKLVVIASPNNPNGTTLSREEIIGILEKNKNTAVLIDEAYYEFSGITCADLIEKYQNLFVVRTFSKAFGMAGLRAGYAVSNQKNIRQLMKIKSPYSLNVFAAAAINAALSDLYSVKKYTSQVMNKSKLKIEAFLAKNNIIFYPSRANFILTKPKNPQKAYGYLKENGILTRPVSDFLRITVGTVKEARKLIRIMKRNISAFR
jgi:histidinol-phosphate aminotransferase